MMTRLGAHNENRRQFAECECTSAWTLAGRHTNQLGHVGSPESEPVVSRRYGRAVVAGTAGWADVEGSGSRAGDPAGQGGPGQAEARSGRGRERSGSTGEPVDRSLARRLRTYEC